MLNCRTDCEGLDIVSVACSRFDTIIELTLAGLLLFMPLAFGAVQPWSREVVIVLSGVIVLSFLLKMLWQKQRSMFRHWAYVPIAALLLIVVLQLVPLPCSLVSVISPNTAALKSELLGDLPNAGIRLDKMTLSFYPHATRHDLRLMLAVAGVFVVVLNVFRRPEQIKRLLMVIAAIGGIVAAIALAQTLFGNGKLYWFISTKYSEGYSGPFVNHSHYGQFMNLSMGAALGLIIVKLYEDFAGKKATPATIATYLGSVSARSLWILIAIIILGITTVFSSLTRGGMVSMLIAVGFTTLMLMRRYSFKEHGWIMVLIALGAFTCVLYVGFDAVYDRLATLRNLDQYSSRWQILKDLTIAFVRFPIVGTGLGTHAVVYPMFDHSTIAALATHAENEYAQVMEEIGLAGFAILVLFGIMVWSAYFRTIRRAGRPICLSAYGLGFGICAILVHSLTDFGQHIPANTFLSAVFCAVILTLGCIRQKDAPAHQTIGISWRRKTFLLLIFIGVLAVWMWAVIGADRMRVAHNKWNKVLAIEKSLVENKWQATGAQYDEIISYAQAALEQQPGNVQYRYWLNVYRWHCISQAVDPDTGANIIPADSMPIVCDIVEQLNEARLLCPTFGPVYCTLGQIEKAIFDDPAGAERIRKGFRLAPCDPVACFAAGLLDIEEGQVDKSVEKFSRAVRLDGSFCKRVVDIYLNGINRPDLAIAVVADDIWWLRYISNALRDMAGHEALAAEVNDRVVDLLEQECSQEAAPAAVFASLGDVYRRRRDNTAAIECYNRALALDYSQVGWHFTLAKLLAEADRIADAMQEARICLRLRPQFKAAESLIADLSVRTEAFAGEINP